jgi:hypothetical protein
VTPRGAHEILGVRSNATAGEVRAAYLGKVRQHHPDLHPDDADSATQTFQRFQAAYETLVKDGGGGPRECLSELGEHKQRIRATLAGKGEHSLDPRELWQAICADHDRKLLAIDGEVLDLLLQLCGRRSQAQANGSARDDRGLWVLRAAGSLKRKLSKEVLLHGYNSLLSLSATADRDEAGAEAAAGGEPPISFPEVLEALEQAGLVADDGTNMIITNWARHSWRCI